MLDNAVVFSWPGIILGALLFGFLFEAVFIGFEYLITGTVGLTRGGLVFGIVAGIGYVVACAIVRRAISREE